MPVHLSEEEVVTIRVLAKKGQKKVAIAKALGVTEGTVRAPQALHVLVMTLSHSRKPAVIWSLSEDQLS